VSVEDNRRINRRKRRNSPERAQDQDGKRPADQLMAWGRLVLDSNGPALRLMGLLAVVFTGVIALVVAMGIDRQLVIDAITLIWARGR